MRRHRANKSPEWVALLAVAFLALTLHTVSGFGEAGVPPSPYTWVFPQPSTADGFSTKESKRFESAWKSFTDGGTKKAQQEWNSLLRKHPKSSCLLTALSYVDFAQQKPAAAVTKLEAALLADPKYIPAVQTLARYFTNQKDYEKAYQYTATLSELQPDNSRAHRDLEELRLLVTDKWFAEAHAARANAKWQEAEFAYLQAMSVAPELETLARELGDIYAYEGKWREAETNYLKAVNLDPTDIEAKKKLADAYMRTNQREKAENLLKELADQNSQDEEIKSMLDRILARMDPEEEALSKIRQRSQINRGDFGALMAITFPFLKEFLNGPPVILTDLESHWGRKYLPLIAGLDLIPAYPNHHFRPSLMMRRHEIAAAIDRLLVLVNRRPNVDLSQVKITDIPGTNPHRDAIARAVSLQFMQLDSDNRFYPQAGVSGAESFRILDAVKNYLR